MLSLFLHISQVTRLANGVTVASVENHSFLSNVSLFVRAGSRYETYSQSGLTHLLRNCAFLVSLKLSTLPLWQLSCTESDVTCTCVCAIHYCPFVLHVCPTLCVHMYALCMYYLWTCRLLATGLLLGLPGRQTHWEALWSEENGEMCNFCIIPLSLNFVYIPFTVQHPQESTWSILPTS